MTATREKVSTQRGTARIVFLPDGALHSSAISEEIRSAGILSSGILVVSTEGRKEDATRLAKTLSGATTLSIAREHVPSEIVERGKAVVLESKATTLVALGGGSAIGLAKALAVSSSSSSDSSTPLRIVAIPTTFSGSEMTSMYGITEGKRKKTGKDERARPTLVIYDPSRLASVPASVLMTSLWNAMAHACEVLWAPAAIVDPATRIVAEHALRLLTKSARALVAGTDLATARADGFEGACHAGATFGDAGAGIHHKLCHVLGGMFDLPHAGTHAALLPHVTRWMSSSSASAGGMAAIARALGVIDPVTSLERLAIDTGVPRSLRDVGYSGSEGDTAQVIEAVLGAPPPCLRALDPTSLKALLVSATSSPVVSFSHDATLRAPAELDGLQPGFGSTHTSEALPGALPKTQNTPRPSPYGLLPELLSGTPFTVKNAQASRVWMYRVRPSYAHSAFHRLPSASRFTSELGDPSPSRIRWAPLPIPKAPESVDFLDGMVTLGGDGDSRGPGYLVSMYAANADMIDRAFSTADGDLLIVPQEGTIDVRTELGYLRAPVGTIVVIPRAIKFAVGVPEGSSRGWMLEVFGPRIRLPERGPIGSNGLADARHFLAPVASYEDRQCPNGFEIVHKLGGGLWSATQEHSPFDVVAWHGVHVPYSYDLMLFNAMGSTTWDHVDPSIHTVLTAPLDDHGRAIVDFVVFRGRWDVAEHSFRPPFMHRNAASEINCVVKTKSIDSGYVPGCTFVSPLLTSHGVSTSTYDAMLEMPDDKHEGPKRLPDDSLWVMFESAFAFRPTRWAETTELIDRDFLALFEGMKTRFDPTRL